MIVKHTKCNRIRNTDKPYEIQSYWNSRKNSFDVFLKKGFNYALKVTSYRNDQWLYRKSYANIQSLTDAYLKILEEQGHSWHFRIGFTDFNNGEWKPL